MEKEKLTLAFNLNIYESKILEILIKKRTSTTGEISSYCNVPRSRIYDVCRTLKRKGFIEIIGKKEAVGYYGSKKYVSPTPIKFRAFTLKEMKENFKKIVFEKAQEEVNLMEKMLKWKNYINLRKSLKVLIR